ncbi:MAG: peptidoglycan DD-metalloendopeptidase family protein [Hyphomonadaceae bacterium]|nr:peptidoglycan DD-metalloendopeptidase family protein [Hyphomonadaceae bacterium]
MARALLLAAVLAAGCASTQPAPIAYGGARAPSGTQTIPSAVAGQDTALAAYALRPEEVQPYHPTRLPRTHRVAEGESLHDIATRYQIPLLALIAHNGLEPPYALIPGRAVQLPRPRIHTVTRGETMATIADRYSMDRRSLLLFNRLPDSHQPRRGDRIALPATAGSASAALAPASEAPPRPTRSGRFRMPVEGGVISRFGAQPGGERRDGIEISGRVGETVRAAADGEVVYAGDDLPAYGALVLIRHADNYVTAYGYNQRLLVRVGERVRAGGAIAELGPRSDGGARLLFQVRQGASAVDPAPLLGLD